MKNISSPIIAICLLLFTSCIKDDLIEVDNSMPLDTETHIEYFGFTLIDTYWDDPTDTEVKTNYGDEVHAFSNVADILAVNPSDNLIERMLYFQSLEMQTVLHVWELFFEAVGTDSPSGVQYALRSNYQSRWDEFSSINQMDINQNMINTFYIGEEPTWNGISFEELNMASSYIKAQFPIVPIMIIESHAILDSLVVPESVDWIGFDNYFVKNPNTDPEYQQAWNTLKSKLSLPTQEIVVIMDSHYMTWAHGDIGNIELDEMDDVANNYYELANSDTTVVAMLGYFWPNAFDFPDAVGARGMPQEVKDTYVSIGKLISGK